MVNSLPTVVVGAGLAGCTLAWQLHAGGVPVVLVDREEQSTSSKVAAGLIAPLSGPRLLPSWRFDEAWAAAMRFYRSIEERFQTRVLHPKTKLHLFTDAAERDLFQGKRAAEFARFVATDSPAIDPDTFAAPHGGFEMSHAAWLDVPAYLNLIKTDFASRGSYRAADIDPAADLGWNGPTVEIPRLGLTADLVIWCEGPTAPRNPFFPGVRFSLAKGEILTLRIPDLRDERILYRGVWLFRVEEGVFRCGSTYEWTDLDSGPTAAGRETILARLRQFLKCPVEVVDHTAAVRPVMEDKMPMAGYHPRCRQLAFVNGLGSKGALLAPLVAERFIDGSSLADATPPGPPLPRGGENLPPLETGPRAKAPVFLPPLPRGGRGGSDLDQELALSRPCGIQLPPRLTELAQTLLKPAIKPGDVVIDATAGNGHDTAFLTKRVRFHGLVFAIDRQPEAIARLSRWLAETPRPRVKLILGDHAKLATLIPSEHHGRVAAVMFNLGYLPDGDHAVTTTAATTAPAIRQAVALLRPGGMMTVLAYTGHAGGPEEAEAVAATLRELGLVIDWKERPADPWATNPPRLFVVRKK